jgi:hypothetical protein
LLIVIPEHRHYKKKENITACEERLVHQLAHGDTSEPCYLVSSDLVCLVVCFNADSSQCFLYLHKLLQKRLVNHLQPIPVT